MWHLVAKWTWHCIWMSHLHVEPLHFMFNDTMHVFDRHVSLASKKQQKVSSQCLWVQCSAALWNQKLKNCFLISLDAVSLETSNNFLQISCTLSFNAIHDFWSCHLRCQTILEPMMINNKLTHACQIIFDAISPEAFCYLSFSDWSIKMPTKQNKQTNKWTRNLSGCDTQTLTYFVDTTREIWLMIAQFW